MNQCIVSFNIQIDFYINIQFVSFAELTCHLFPAKVSFINLTILLPPSTVNVSQLSYLASRENVSLSFVGHTHYLTLISLIIYKKIIHTTHKLIHGGIISSLKQPSPTILLKFVPSTNGTLWTERVLSNLAVIESTCITCCKSTRHSLLTKVSFTIDVQIDLD